MTTDTLHLDDELLQALAAGLEDDAARSHVVTCDRCAEAVDAYRVLFAGLDELVDPVPDAAFVPEVMARVEAAVAPQTHPSRVPLLAGLAAVLATVGLGVAWLLGGGTVAGVLVDGAQAFASVAKVQTYLGDLLGALPPVAGASLVIAQLLFLGLLAFGFTRLVRGMQAEPMADIA